MNRSIPSKTKERAAQMLAVGRFTMAEIAQKCDISDRTLYLWQRSPKFAARVDEIVKSFAERAFKRGLAQKEQRLLALQQNYNRLEDLLEMRRARSEFSFIPDYASGLVAITELVRVKDQASTPVAAAESEAGPTQTVPADQSSQQSQPWALSLAPGALYKVRCQIDHATITTMNEILDQIAGEVGDRVSKSEIVFPRKIEDLSDEQLYALARRLGMPEGPATAFASGTLEGKS